MEFLTREFLSTNFHKSDLQLRCRELGLSKVWVNKEQLIDMIMANTPTTDQNSDISLETTHETPLPDLDVANPYLTPGRTHYFTLTPDTPISIEHQNTNSPPTPVHHDTTQPTPPSAATTSTSASLQNAATPAPLHGTASPASNESVLTNRDVEEEHYPDQTQNEVPTTVRKRKVNI